MHHYTQKQVLQVSDHNIFGAGGETAGDARPDGTSLISRSMRRPTARASALFLLLSLIARVAASGQDSLLAGPSSRTASPPAADSSVSRFARYLRYPWNGVNLWAGNAFETRSAAHNQHFAGSMRVVGLQISRDLWRGQHSRLAYVGEVLPVVLVRSGPPISRLPDTLKYYDAREIERYSFREGYGFGLAPFGLEVSRQLTPRLSALANMTAGALLFSKIIPYGAATKANFTVSPGVALQWEPIDRTRIAFGYTFHHLSNASFGFSNPGMNSQILYVRVARVRRAAAGGVRSRD